MRYRRGRSSNERWHEFPTTSPRPVADGIKAESRRGQIGSTWWSKRWISVLESFGWDSRLTRGRTYARKGQVIDIHIACGQVTAQVQGSRVKPYRVRIQIPVLSDAVWNTVYQAMAKRALFLASLLNGTLPDEIEDAFPPEHPLLPRDSRQIDAECSCPDWANPCKHIAAVYYLLAEEFDRDPFMIFHLRGRTKEQVLRSLSIVNRAHPDMEVSNRTVGPPGLEPTLEINGFYDLRDADRPVLPPVTEPIVAVSVLKRLGPLPLSQPVDLSEHLQPLYRAITQWAIAKATDGKEDTA